jgi:hypothetical protein
MKRMAGTIIVLAALGGCSSVSQGPEVGEKAYSDGRPVPAGVQANWRQHDQLPAPCQYSGGASASRSCAANNYGSGAVAQTSTAVAPVQTLPRSAASPSTTGALAFAASPGSGYNYPPAERTSNRFTPSDTDVARDPVVGDPLKTPLLLPPKELKMPVITSTAPPALLPPPRETVRDLPASSSRSGTPMSLKDQTMLPPPGSITTVGLDQRPQRLATPAVRMINSKRITLNFEVKDVGPSGLSGVDLYYTQDTKIWKKGEAPPQTKSPYVIEVNDEGLYGFTLVAHNGVGMGKEPPQPGDQPQVWVEVDQTKPVVRLQGIEETFSGNNQSLVVRWTANDKNLGPKPISLLYAEKEGGPWQPMASNVENSGKYAWPITSGMPTRLYVRVEATDLVGNIAGAQTPTPIVIDVSQPTVSILGVEPGR